MFTNDIPSGADPRPEPDSRPFHDPASVTLISAGKPNGRTIKAIAIKTPPQAPDDMKLLN